MSLADLVQTAVDPWLRRAEPHLARGFARLLDAPPALLRPISRRGPHPEGLELDPQLAVAVRLADVVLPRPLHEMPVDEARAAYLRSSRLADGRRPDGVTSRDLDVATGSLRARLYEPRHAGPRSAGILYLHGGGFVIGNLDSHDTLCAELARDTGARLVAIDYRLAPEHRFPAAPDDAIAAYAWLLEHAEELGIDPGRIAIAGDSAGGNLAAVACLDARDRGLALPRVQALIYPATDMTCSSDSHRSFGEGYLLTKPLKDWFLAQYLPPGQDLRDPRCSPLHATSHADLPKAIVITAGFDLLRDEGRAYAARLEAAGVPVERQHHPSLVHGFATMTGTIRAARAAVEQLSASLRRALAD
jgi:acetyl esterase